MRLAEIRYFPAFVFESGNLPIFVASKPDVELNRIEMNIAQ